MEKVKIFDKEYNCSKRVYYHIKGLESEKRYLKMEVNTKDKEIIKLQERIDKAIEYIKENEKEYGSLEDNEKIILDILRGNDEN